jgi:hypothetical protein
MFGHHSSSTVLDDGMPSLPNAQHEELIVSFGTPVAEADAAAVAATMQAVVTLFDAANDEVSPNAPLGLKARAFTAGSLELPLEIIGPSTLFVAAHLPKIAAVLGIVKQYFEIRLLAKGKKLPPPDSKGQISIENITLNNNGTINLLVNSQVNGAVGIAASAIEADDTIKKVEILQGKKRTPLVRVEREQLPYLKVDEQEPIIETPKKRTRVLKKASLVVRSPDLLGDSMWAFNYKSHKIEASLQDNEFLLEVHNGSRSFTAGTELVADMTVDEEFDAGSAAYVPRKYVITRVHSLKKQKLLSSTKKTANGKKAAKSPKKKGKKK